MLHKPIYHSGIRSPNNPQGCYIVSCCASQVIYDSASISPAALLISKRTLLTDKDLYKKGLIEVQDEGSQLISYALGPDPKWRILDACAGAGGKTLHLAAIQKDQGNIIAFNKYGITIPGLGSDDHMLTLYPSKHGCDGFFMARMKKVSV